MTHRSAGALFLFLLCSASQAFAEAPESVVRRYLASVYDGRFDALPKTADARTESFERQVRNILRVRCVTIDRAIVSVVDVHDDRIVVHADVAIVKTDRAWSAIDLVPLRIVLVRGGEEWLIEELRNRDEELAQQLLGAKGEAREQLLAMHRDAITKGVVRAIYAPITTWLTLGKVAEAADATALAQRLAVATGDRGGEALALGVKQYTSQGDLIRMASEGLAIAETLDDPDVLARLLYDRGRSVRGPQPNGDSPIPWYRKALEVSRRAEDPTIATRVLYSLSLRLASNNGDYLNARRFVDEGLELARDVGDELSELSFAMVLTTIYEGQSDVERAYEHNQRALEVAKELGALAYPSLLMRRGCLLIDLGRYEEGQKALEELITRHADGSITTPGSSPPRHIGSALRCLGLMEARRGNFAEAACLNDESAVLGGSKEGSNRYELAPHYLTRGESARALEEALRGLAGNSAREGARAFALVTAARAYRNLGDLDHAMSAAVEAIEMREELDTMIAGDEQQRASATTVTTDSYAVAAEISLMKGNAAAALAYLERGRARVLTDILENGRGTAELSAELRAEQTALDREVANVTRELERANAANDREAIARATEDLRRARAVRGTFIDGLRVRAERRAITRRLVDDHDVANAATRLPNHTVAVDYFVTDHDLHAFVIGANGVTVRSTKIERTELERDVDAFLDMLTRGDLRVESEGKKLHSLLLGPIENEIAGAEAMLIIPDGALWHVPFAALVDRKGAYAIERAAIVYAPSLMAYASIVGSDKRPHAGSIPLLAIGNPIIDSATRTAAASVYRSASLGPLPDAEHEVDAVRSVYGAPRSLVLKRQYATESRIKTALGDARIAHFATHAILDDTNPMYSRLMLARDEAAHDDGWLESWEVARLDLQADLVVLSACDTARGEVGGGEGVIGLTWSFFLAGASSTVATQWKVASDSTADFMIAFHRALHDRPANRSMHKALALREAQLRLLRDKRTRHPFHWAPFVLLGNPAAAAE